MSSTNVVGRRMEMRGRFSMIIICTTQAGMEIMSCSRATPILGSEVADYNGLERDLV